MDNLFELYKPIRDFQIPKRIIHCRPDVLASDVVKAMAEKNVGDAVITTETREVLGVVTERDLLIKALARNIDLSTIPISELMTNNPTTIDDSTPLNTLVDMMVRKKFRRMIVTDTENKLLCMVTLSDIVEIYHRITMDL